MPEAESRWRVLPRAANAWEEVLPYAPGDGETDADSVPLDGEIVTVMVLLLDAAKVESPL